MEDNNLAMGQESAEVPDPILSTDSVPVVVPTHPEIKGEDKENWCTVLEVCGDKIITGWNEGQIKIYSKAADLECVTLLPSTHDGEGKVTCLKCISSTEIIAGYCDGTVCLWNEKILVETFSVAQTEDNSDDEHANCLRWREPKLVVGTNEGRVCIYNRNADSTFTLERNWDSKVPSVERLEIYETNVILLPASHLRLGCLYVHSLRGERLQTISAGPGNLFDMVMYDGHVIAGGNEKVLRIWNVETGTCVKTLEGHDDYITTVDIHDNIVVSGDRSGEIIIWDIKAALEGAATLEMIKNLPDEYFEGVPRWGLKLGRNFLVRHCPESSKIVVMDLPLQ